MSHPRPPLTFSLRTLMILMAVGAPLIAWYVQPILVHRRQEAAARELTAKSKELQLRRTPQGGRWIEEVEIYGPTDTTLIRNGALSRFPELRKLTIRPSRTQFSNIQLADLAGLRECKKLHQVFLSGKQFDHRAIAELKALPALDTLYLDHTSMAKVTEEFAALPRLQVLSVTSSELTDEQMRSLRQLKELEEIRLGGNSVTDEGFANLSTLQALHTIDLSHTSVTDQAIQKFTDLPHLTRLDLINTQVTGDFGLQPGDWPKLRSFIAINTAFNDQGLTQLAHCQELEALDLGDTEITGEALLAFVHNAPQLQQLSISSKNIPPEIVQKLAGHPTLRYLMLRGVYEGLDSQALADSMPQKCELHLNGKAFRGRGQGQAATR